MKKLLYILLLAPVVGFSQRYDCNAKPVTFVIGMDAGISNGYVINGIKVGLWQNNKPSGFTLTAGYANVLAVTKGKTIDSIPTYTPTVELGYKIRVNNWFVLHTLTGANSAGQYLGCSALFQADKLILIGVGYKQKVVGLNIYLAL